MGAGALRGRTERAGHGHAGRGGGDRRTARKRRNVIRTASRGMSFAVAVIGGARPVPAYVKPI